MNYLQHLIKFPLELYHSRTMLKELAIKDFKSRYLGSYLGVVWAFIQPALMIGIYWFVFSIGFKSVPIDNIPFIIWLVSGIIPWFYFSECFLQSTNSIISNSFLVKKIVFRVSILPITSIMSSLFVHLFFIIILFVLLIAYKIPITLYFLQIFYYLFSLMLLILGLSWITSSIVIFLKDISQIVAMSLQVLFWITPVFWSFSIVPEKFHILFKLNPLYYIVEGYRNCFIYHQWFWEQPYLTLYYWGITLFFLIVGALVFKRLRPHFADVI
ncbi:ABC transporter permease [Paenibacillus planticolens]|uniref:Transport permease protein n=1 Tax=Paenibacillus planticolens TaxID=2654976 RepID=A0ABX1ZL71_9BACL|nr:ABC transporter permease [Paenibacillus planticolens]NOV00278.1 ABC transporter permease [Paenibacillus planticolens]